MLFRSEIMFKFKSTKDKHNGYIPNLYEVGDRVGQLIIMPYPQIEFEPVLTLTETERGTGGFGSTGN